MTGVEPDEDICEMIMRTTNQEALSGLKRGLLSLFSASMNGSEVTNKEALIRAQIDASTFNTFAQACEESGIALTVVNLDVEKNITTFEFPAERLGEMQKITNEMIEKKLIKEPLQVLSIEDSKDDLDKLTSLLKEQGVGLSARTDEQGCAEFTIKAKSWDKMAQGLEKAALANGELVPSFVTLPLTEELLGALKSNHTVSGTDFRAYVNRSDDGETSVVIDSNEAAGIEEKLASISTSDISASVQEEAQRMQQQLASILKSIDEAKTDRFERIVSSAKAANKAAENAGQFVKDRNRQAELVR